MLYERCHAGVERIPDDIGGVNQRHAGIEPLFPQGRHSLIASLARQSRTSRNGLVVPVMGKCIRRDLASLAPFYRASHSRHDEGDVANKIF